MRRPTTMAAVLLGTVLPLVATVAGWAWFVDGPWLILVGATAGFVAGARLGPRSAAAVVALLTMVAVVASQRFDAEAYHWLDDAVFFGVVTGGPAIAGAVTATRARQARRLELLERELVAQRGLESRAAALEERLRIRSSVHERLAERIAAIAILAEGARRRGDGAVMAAIETEARTALDRLREVIGVLRDGSADEPERASERRASEDTLAARRLRAEEAASGQVQAGEPAAPRRLGVVDLTVPVGLALVMAVEIAVVPHARGPLWANAAASVLVAAPLAVRRSRPFLAVVGSTALSILMSLLLTPPAELVTGVALVVAIFYAVGAWVPGHAWLLAWIVAAAGAVLLEWAAATTPEGTSPQDGDVLVVLLWSVVVTGLGRLAAGWQSRLQRTRSVVGELERRRAVEVRLAGAREREAAASRLHDTVAHAMSVVCLHAGAQQRGATDAYSALSVIVAVAEESLAELREEVDATLAAPLDPSQLTAMGRRLGVDVDVTVSPDLSSLHGSLAQRVIREALVNITRHAPGARATVRVDEQGGRLRIEVSDDGPVPAGLTGGPASHTGAVALLTHKGTGTGLLGLCEAVGAAGGSLDWGVRDGGGFHVGAVLPLVPR